MFWTYAAQFVADVYNMTVVPYKKSKTPYELRYPHRPLPMIPHFGSLVTFVPKDREKFSSRSRPGILLGYAQMPGGHVTNEFVVVPLECFTKGLNTINLVTTRDIRLPPSYPYFQIKEWNKLAETRSYIENFKPLCGEQYYDNIFMSKNNGISLQRDIVILVDGELEEPAETDADIDPGATPTEIPQEFIDPQSEVLEVFEPEVLEVLEPDVLVPVPIPEEIPIAEPIETPQMRERAKAIKLSMERSERMRKMAADRARAKSLSVSSAALSVPLRPDILYRPMPHPEGMHADSLGTHADSLSRRISDGISITDSGYRLLSASCPPSPVIPVPLLVNPLHRTSPKPATWAASVRMFDLFEYACSDDSSIGIVGPDYNIKVCRLTLRTCDLTTKLGFRTALGLVRSNPGASIHSSIPCTPWSTWNYMNSHKLGHAFNVKLAKSRVVSLQMLNYFFIIAKEVLALGGDISFEWPREATGWKLDVLQKFIERFKLMTVHFDGCAFGLKSKKGNPIKKPWRIVTSSQTLVDSLSPHVCVHKAARLPIMIFVKVLRL